MLKDKDNNTLEPGIYEIHLSSDGKIFYFIQSRKIVMTVPVVQIEKIEQKKEEDSNTDKTKKKKKKKEKKLTEQELKLKKVQEEAKQQARLKASIEDSHKGYYILHYKDSKSTSCFLLFRR